MGKPLALEYKSKRRLFSFEAFNKLKYGIKDTSHNKFSEKKVIFENEETKVEEEDRSEFN